MTTTLFLFPFFFLFFFFRVTKFGMLLIFTEKSGFIQQQSCFSSHLSRAIDKIPVWGPCAILAGPDGFFRTCSRHHVRPSYGDFLNSFAMKARAGPYGSYNKPYYYMTLSSPPLLALLLAPFFAPSLTLVPRSFFLNRTEKLATQAKLNMTKRIIKELF